jgi:hypothetical protein
MTFRRIYRTISHTIIHCLKVRRQRSPRRDRQRAFYFARRHFLATDETLHFLAVLQISGFWSPVSWFWPPLVFFSLIQVLRSRSFIAVKTVLCIMPFRTRIKYGV